jgi:Holliday junction resolvase RusA-like endonuclease
MTKKELKYVNSLKEENERVKNMLLRFVDALGKLKNLDDVVNVPLIPLMTEENKKIRAEIKAEAYKECIEKVKNEIDTYEHLSCEECECVPISKEDIDNLLKELVGEGK